ISRALIEVQGGLVGVESSPGKGATFWFTLPLPEPEVDGLNACYSTGESQVRSGNAFPRSAPYGGDSAPESWCACEGGQRDARTCRRRDHPSHLRALHPENAASGSRCHGQLVCGKGGLIPRGSRYCNIGV